MKTLQFISFLSISLCHEHPVNALLPTPNLDKGFNILESASKILPQGQLVKGAKESWKFLWRRFMAELAPQDKTGQYTRPSYSFDGTIGTDEFPDEPGRYHLYTGNPCPWCHRVRLAARLRGVTSDEMGQTSLVDDPVKASRGGWVFGTDNDPLGSYDLRELYDKLSANYKGRCTAPLLVDLKTKRIVSNESSDIVRMLNDATFGKEDTERMNLCPPELKESIDETNTWVYELLNNGVYKCGFSTQQSAYDQASADVRKGFNRVESTLSDQAFLCGDAFTEADLRLLPTVLRFDGAYAGLFRAGGGNLRVRDYPNLLNWLQRCWDMEGVKETIDLDDAVSSYYRQLFPLNPGGLIPTTITTQEMGLK